MKLSDFADPPLLPRVGSVLPPLTALQLRSWKRLAWQKLRSHRSVRQASVRIRGALDVRLLRNCIETVVHRHESLRTRIVLVGGLPKQQVDSPCELEMKIVDLASARSKTEAEIERATEEFFGEEVDLARGPLFAAKLLRLNSDEYLLLLGIDHMVGDGASCAVMRKEIWTLYSQGVLGARFSLPPLRVQFADYALWQQTTYAAWQQKHEPYWKRRLNNAPRLELPFVNGLSEVQEPMWMNVEIPLGRTLTTELAELAWRQRTLLPMLMLALTAAVISRWTNQRDFVIPFVSHGRYGSPQLTNMIGFLSSILYLRIEVAEADTFTELSKRVDREFRLALQHQDFGRVPDLVPECIGHLSFNWTPPELTKWPISEVEKLQCLQITPLETRRSSWRMRGREPPHLSIVGFPGKHAVDGEIVLNIMYGTDALAHSTVEKFGRNLRSFAELFTQNPLAAIPMLAFPMKEINTLTPAFEGPRSPP